MKLNGNTNGIIDLMSNWIDIVWNVSIEYLLLYYAHSSVTARKFHIFYYQRHHCNISLHHNCVLTFSFIDERLPRTEIEKKNNFVGDYNYPLNEFFLFDKSKWRDSCIKFQQFFHEDNSSCGHSSLKGSCRRLILQWFVSSVLKFHEWNTYLLEAMGIYETMAPEAMRQLSQGPSRGSALRISGLLHSLEIHPRLLPLRLNMPESRLEYKFHISNLNIGKFGQKQWFYVSWEM